MNHVAFHKRVTILAFKCGVMLAAGVVCLSSAFAGSSLANGLISYWPLDSTNNGLSTPDLQSGYDLVLLC